MVTANIQEVILSASHFICSLVDCQGTCDLRGSSSIHNTVVSDQIANYTQSIMESTLGLFNDLLMNR